MKRTLTTTLALLVVAGTSFGQFLWDGDTDTNFANPDNWLSGVAPNTTGQVIIRNVSDSTPFAPELTTLYKTGPTGVGGDFFVGDSGGSGTLDINAGGTLDSSGNWVFLGSGGGTGVINVNNGGSIISDTDLRLDSSTSGINVSSGGSINIGGEIAGPGFVKVTGTGNITTGTPGFMGIENFSSNSFTGTVNAASVIGYASSGNDISGGSVNSGQEVYVGNGAGVNADLTITSGSISTNNWLAVGRDGSTGVLNVEGGTVDVATGNVNAFYAIGTNNGSGSGNGTVNQSGGVTNTTSIWLGENASAMGAYNLSGGTLTVGAFGGTGDINVGYSDVATGSMTISGDSTLNASGTLRIGVDGTTTGEVVVVGSNATINLTTIALAAC